MLHGVRLLASVCGARSLRIARKPKGPPEVRGAAAVRMLQQLHTHELAMHEEDQSIDTYLRRSGFDREQEGAHIRVYRDVSGYQVSARFHATAIPENSKESVRFEVEVTRGRESLFFHCVRGSEALRILSLRHSAHDYVGPSFPTLDAQLQKSLQEFLQMLGVTNDFALFVESVAMDAELKLYFDWIQETKELIKLTQ